MIQFYKSIKNRRMPPARPKKRERGTSKGIKGCLVSYKKEHTARRAVLINFHLCIRTDFCS